MRTGSPGEACIWEGPLTEGMPVMTRDEIAPANTIQRRDRLAGLRLHDFLQRVFTLVLRQGAYGFGDIGEKT